MSEVINNYTHTVSGSLEVEKEGDYNYYFFYNDSNIGCGWEIAVYDALTKDLDILANEEDFDEAIVDLGTLIEEVQDYIQGL